MRDRGAAQRFQGRPISFTVSPAQQVTAISVGYQVDACSGVDTFSDLNGVPFTAGTPAFQFTATLQTSDRSRSKVT
jgi:hypothetical protein